MMTMRTTISFAAGIVALTCLATAPAAAQVQAGPFTAFPSEDVTDARFLSAVSGRDGLTGESTSVGLSVPFGRTEFLFRIFDGDTGEPCDPSVTPETCFDAYQSFGHWDEGGTPLCATMYFDPLREGNTDPADVVGVWCGNQPIDPLVDPNGRWQTAQDRMPDNDWWNVTVRVTPEALSPGGTAFYHVVLSLDAALDDGATVSNFKGAADVPLSVYSSNFGFEAGLAEGLGKINDFPIVYPGFVFPDSFFDPLFFVESPTTYDGSYTFFLDVPNQIETINVWDGDFDHGTGKRFDRGSQTWVDLLTGEPSGVPFDACADTDDANTPNEVPDFANPTAARPEGVAFRLVRPNDPNSGVVPGVTANPADDNNQDFLRRSPCVRYEVTDPLGNVYENLNPSGNREWERFVISSSQQDADYYVTDPDALPGGFLPTGLWKIEVFGLDMSNSNFWRFDLAVCGLVNGQPLCPEEPVVIGDRVWYDLDGDGVQDPGEPGIPGVKLNRVGSTDMTATTDDGLYLFDVLPGAFEVPAVYTVEVAPENLAEIPTGAVGDRLWLDLDGDGFDSDEPGIPNVTVRLSTAGPAGCNPASIAITTTDVDGHYWFSGLATGEYCTRVDAATLPAGLAQTFDPDGTLDGQAATVIDPVNGPAIDDTLDYGYALADPTRAALGDRVWVDYDLDGLQDEGEAGLGGVRVRLYSCSADPAVDAPLTFVSTDPGGFYFFGDLEPACYLVAVDPTTLPAGFVATYDLDSGTGAPDGATEYDLSAGEIFLDVDFGYAGESYCLTDVLWYDADANGFFDGADEPIAGVTVNLVSGGQVIAATSSGDDGSFQFCGLRTNEYVLEITDREGALSGLMGTTQAGVDGSLRALIAGADFAGVDFGYIEQGWLSSCLWTTNPFNNDPPVEVLEFTPTSITDEIPFDANGIPGNNLDFDFGCRPQGSIGDRVWQDDDGDGIQDPLEPGIGGVTVELLDCSGQLIETVVTSDGSQDVDGDGSIDPVGYYAFTGLLPDCYVVRVVPATLPAGYEQTFDLDGTLDDETEINLGFNENRDDVDFGYQPALGSIGDRVWQDDDGNGVQDPKEPGIGGVIVQLFDCSGQLLATAKTDAAGFYSFGDLPAGCYDVVVDPATVPTGYEQTFDLDGVLDGATRVDLAAAENRTDVDFGYQPLGSIGDRVWRDGDGDGVQDAEEPGIGGVIVQLFDCSGKLLATAKTDAAGFYSFGDLPAGCYEVVVDPTTLPAGYEQTFDLDGVLDGTTRVDLAAGENRTDVDFGYQPPAACSLEITKTCRPILPPSGDLACEAKIAAFLVRYIGPDIFGATVVFEGDHSPAVTYSDVDLISGVTVLSMVAENGYSIDAAPDEGDLGAKSRIFINGVEEEIHTSCSTPFVAGLPAPLNNPKGDPSPNWLVESFRDKLGNTVAPPVAEGSDVCELTSVDGTLCSERPSSLSLRFNGGDCLQSMNKQPSDKWDCSGDAGSGPVRIVARKDNDIYLDDADVEVGEIIDLLASAVGRDDLDSEIQFDIYSGGSLVQEIYFHTSCSKPLAIGDEFGSLEVMAFVNSEQGRVLSGSNVEYLYVVENIGEVPAVNVEVDDTPHGFIGSTASLAPDESVTFSKTLFIDDDVVNTGIVTADSIGGTCTASDTAEVVVTVPPEPCSECSGGVTQLDFENVGPGAYVAVFDDKDQKADKILFEGFLASGDRTGPLSGSRDDGKFESDVSIWVDGERQAKIHTSCSQPIGIGFRYGDFEVVSGRSREGGPFCEADCSPATVDFRVEDDEIKWKIANNGVTPLQIQRIVVEWPDGKGDLEKIEFDGTIWEGSLAPTMAEVSDFIGDAKQRALKAGDDHELKLRFDDKEDKGDHYVRVEFNNGCFIEEDSTAPPGGVFECSKPIDALTMVWDGAEAVRIKAWKGDVGSTLLADVDDIPAGGVPGTASEVTVSGFAGSPNDVYWEIFAAGSSVKLGESKFHLSCSDDDMDGPEDCGLRQGNGKSDDSGLINDWLLEGMVDSDETLDCS